MLRFAVNPRWTDLPFCSALLNGFPRDYVVHDYQTTLSIKSVVRGAARYETPNGQYLVTPDVFLVLNHDQRYSMEVDESSKTETLCSFFQRGFVEAAEQSRARSEGNQLDDPERRATPVEFCQRLYPADGAVGTILSSMRAAVRDDRTESSWIEQRFFDLAEAMAGLRDTATREMQSFPGLRPSTRDELYRRLYRARDYLLSCYSGPVSVSDAASVAALSPFHFQRRFKEAFGVSPIQFLQKHRLSVAHRMLAEGSDVTSACYAVGFQSLGSFSWLFRQRFGVSPSKVGTRGVPR
jgi:AraC family transcriptional regulator